MTSQPTKRSATSIHHSRSPSSDELTDAHNVEQHPKTARGGQSGPRVVQDSQPQESQTVETQPRPASRVIRDSFEGLSDYDFSADEHQDEVQPAPSSNQRRPSNSTTVAVDNSKAQEELDSVSDSGTAATEELDPQDHQPCLTGQTPEEDSFNTVDTVLVQPGTKPTPRHTLHQQGINCNGRLAVEHPDVDEEMEEEATQPSTQPHLDPRRFGSSSLLSLKDEADVVCILHPSTPPAFKAIEILAKYAPQHILQNQDLSRNLDFEAEEQVAYGGEATTEPNEPNDVDSFHDTPVRDVRETRMPESSTDIALRFSSKVHSICMGWTFGRNPVKCDLPLVEPNLSRDAKEPKEPKESLKISNMHFRIYLNASGVLMLEDTSTNGTWVDKVHLVSGQLNAGHKPRRTIQPGSIIEVLMSPPHPVMRFLVGVPSRDRAEAKYNLRLSEYMAQVKQMERELAIAAQNTATGNLMPPPPVLPFGHMHHTTGHNAQAIIAPSTSYNHGMSWNGGEHFNVVGHIGKGAFANVYRLATKQDGEVFAAKEIEKRRFMKDGVLSHKAQNEIVVMKQLHHPNIIDYVSCEETTKHFYIIMEYVSYGDLSQYVTGTSVLPEFKCQYVAHQMMSALEYLHKQKITHRDIKPDNILIASNDPFVVKLTDFGLSKVIADEGTFLKTFCGTLLYCAPEVYPGYEKAKEGIRQKRSRGTDEKKLPYKQSVDTWAFAAVLYHLLCGKPPFMASVEDRGAQMLDVIMNNPADFERLARSGVSVEGVDFVEKMLIREPSQRASDAQCLRHPWIAHLSRAVDDDMETQVPELDASQLSLNDVPEEDDSDEDEDSDFDTLNQLRRSKRMRTKSPHAMGFRPQDPASSGDSYNTIPLMIVPAVDREAVRSVPYQGPGRLYGEIGASALRSSGVFGEDIPMEGSHDGSVSVSDVSPVNLSTESRLSDDVSRSSLQYPQPLPGPAPSLLGTEALVDQMNMASPESAGPSAPSVDSKSGTPHTPQTRESSPAAVTFAKRPGPEMSSNPELAASKRAKSHRSSTPSHHGQTDDPPPTSPTAEITYQGTVSQNEQQEQAVLPKSGIQKAAAGQETSETRGQPSGGEDASKKKATTASSSKGARQQNTAPSTSHTRSQRNDDSSSDNNSSTTSTAQDNSQPSPSFPLPAPVLGRLNTVPGSVIETTHFNLTNRVTYYGRHQEQPPPVQPGQFSPPFTSYIYPQNLDNRVPKNALDLCFWRTDIEKDERRGIDWVARDDFWCIVMTRTSACIWVNGVRLTRGKDHTKYGKLYTGDVITIFGPKDENAMGKAKEYLKFECEFFAGLSKHRRPEGQQFTIEKEFKHHQENAARRSRESSMASAAPDTATEGSGSTTPAPEA